MYLEAITWPYAEGGISPKFGFLILKLTSALFFLPFYGHHLEKCISEITSNASGQESLETDGFRASNLLGISNILIKRQFQDHTIHNTTWLKNLKIHYLTENPEF